MFLHPLTLNDEYWLGYFRADGSISTKGNSTRAVFGQARFHPVSEFASHVNRQGAVLSRASQTNYGFYVYHTVRTDKETAYNLLDLGVKSTLHPSLYHSRHFWRGFIDGDGCIKYFNKRPPNKWDPGLQVVGSLIDMTALQCFIAAHLSGYKAKIFWSERSHIYSLALSGNRAKYFLHLLYDDSYTANVKKFQRVKEVLDRHWSTHHLSWKPPHV